MLPADLQAMVLATAQDVGTEVPPWVIKGGKLDVLSSADKAENDGEPLATALPRPSHS
jgi:hypothetical protein